MQVEKDEKKEGTQNTSTRELFIDSSPDDLPAERMLDIDEAGKKAPSKDKNGATE